MTNDLDTAENKRIQPTWRCRKGDRKPADIVPVTRPRRFGNPFKVEEGRVQAEAGQGFRDWLADDATINEPEHRRWNLEHPELISGGLGSQSHHEDYVEPLAVVWLRRWHHREGLRFERNCGQGQFLLSFMLEDEV